MKVIPIGLVCVGIKKVIDFECLSLPGLRQLQLEKINHDIKHIMIMLNPRYAIYYNKRHHFVGYVFQGRYGVELIETMDYQLEVSRSNHLNPLKVKIVATPEEYRWSSYLVFITNKENPYVEQRKSSESSGVKPTGLASK